MTADTKKLLRKSGLVTGIVLALGLGFYIWGWNSELNTRAGAWGSGHSSSSAPYQAPPSPTDSQPSYTIDKIEVVRKGSWEQALVVKLKQDERIQFGVVESGVNVLVATNYEFVNTTNTFKGQRVCEIGNLLQTVHFIVDDNSPVETAHLQVIITK